MSKKNKNQNKAKEVKETVEDEKIIEGSFKEVEAEAEDKAETEDEPTKEGIMSWVTVKEKRRKAGSYAFAFVLGAGVCFAGMLGFGKYLEGKDIADVIDPATKAIPDLVSEAVKSDVSEVTAEAVVDAVVENV